MAIAAGYFDLVREMKDATARLRLVESAKQIGIRPTARLFATTVPGPQMAAPLCAARPFRTGRAIPGASPATPQDSSQR